MPAHYAAGRSTLAARRAEIADLERHTAPERVRAEKSSELSEYLEDLARWQREIEGLD